MLGLLSEAGRADAPVFNHPEGALSLLLEQDGAGPTAEEQLVTLVLQPCGVAAVDAEAHQRAATGRADRAQLSAPPGERLRLRE